MDSRRLDSASETLAVVKEVIYLIKNGGYRRIVEKQRNCVFQNHPKNDAFLLETKENRV